MHLRRQVASLLTPALRVRGQAGRELLDALFDASSPLPEALAAHLEQPAAPQPVPASGPGFVELGDCERVVLVGDVHGRWDVIEPALHTAGVLDAAGHWCAPPGTALVQVGDVLDADLTARFDQQRDPDGDELVATFRDTVEAVLHSLSAASPTRTLAAHLLNGTLARGSLWHQRHALVGACLVARSVDALRRIEAEAQAAGGRVVVLMGNHELDLLAGRFWWYAAQKRFWLALEGLDAQAIERAAGSREALSALASSDRGTLRWLMQRPLAARVCQRFLVVHGGPTRATTDDLLAARIEAPAPLAAWFDTLAAADFDHDAFAEGRSLFSPVRSVSDDFIGDLELLQPWLQAADVDWLVVGHSPFLGFPPSSLVDADAPEVAQRLGAIERLGVHGNVLAVDTNLKRADTAEVLVLDPMRGRLAAVRAGGLPRGLLHEDESLDAPRGNLRALRTARALLADLDQHRAPELVDLVEPGLDAELFDEALAILDAPEHASDDALRQAVIGLLRAFPASTARLRTLLQRLARGDTFARGLLVAWHDALAARARELADALEPQEGAWRLQLDARRTTVEGVRFSLVERVIEALWQRMRAGDLPQRPAIAMELVADRAGAPALRELHFAPGRTLAHHEALLVAPPQAATSWAALETFARAQLAEATPSVAPPVRHPTSSPSVAFDAGSNLPRRMSERPCLPRAALEALLVANAAALGLTEVAAVGLEGVELDGGALRPGWCELRGPWPRLRAALTSAGELLLADTAFVDAGGRFTALRLDRRGEIVGRCAQGEVLGGALPESEGRVVLFSQARQAVAARLLLGEVEGLLAGRRAAEAPWRSGCMLFTTPTWEAAQHFAAVNPVALRFSVPRGVLEGWQSEGLAQLGLMIADHGARLDPEARWGAADVALEVVALGAEGVRALWAWRA